MIDALEPYCELYWRSFETRANDSRFYPSVSSESALSKITVGMWVCIPILLDE